MKEKKRRQKVIPHCYRKKLSRTLSNSSISQLIQLGTYKKRINDLSRNNRQLAIALQDARLEAAIQHNMLKDCAKDCNKVLFAQLKLNEMAKNIAKFVADLEEVRSHLDIDLLSLKFPYNKKGSPNEKIRKEPDVNCIDEITEESSVNEVVTAESTPAVSDPGPSLESDDKKSVIPDNLENNDEDMDIAPILFVDDSKEKKKKSSVKSRTSKVSFDPDKESLTPELNIDLTCIKLKRNSSRRQTQFIFPSSRSTSKGKISSTGKENLFEESVTPAKPTTPTFIHHEKDAIETRQSPEKIFNSPSSKDIKESENQDSFPKAQLKPNIDANENYFSNVTTINPVKLCNNIIAPKVLPGESNHTVLLCEDMELTEVIRPVHPIIIENGLPFMTKPLDNDNLSYIIKDTKENNAMLNSGDNDLRKIIACNGNDVNKEVNFDKDSEELFSSRPNTPELPKIDDKLLKLSENDEFQNVGMITFCEPNFEDENNAHRSTNSNTRESRRAKPVKYAVFFSSDDSDESSPFEIIKSKSKTSKRKTVIPFKTGEFSENTENTISHHKVSLEKENEMTKNDNLKCSVDILHSKKSEKKLEKKSSKKSKDIKVSSKNDLPKSKSSKKNSTSSDENVKIPKYNNENVKKLTFSPISVLKSTDQYDSPKQPSQKCSTISDNESVNPRTNENIKNVEFSPCSFAGILKKSQSNPQTITEVENKTLLKKVIYNDNIDNSITSVTESPKSESRKVSFASTDLVCNFRRMSVSKKIAENKKVRRTSKSVLDFEELLEEKAQTTETSHVSARNSSESTNTKKLGNPHNFNFSDDTELYTFNLLSNSNFSTVPTTDVLMPASKYVAASNASQKNVQKKSKPSKKILNDLELVKSSGKLSLKKHKDSKTVKPQPTSNEILKEKDVLLYESPVSIGKLTKRKSLFKEHFDGESKENVNHEIIEKPKSIAQGKDKIPIILNSESTTQNNVKIKHESKTQGKISTKKLSGKPKLLEPTPETKKKKHSTKNLENSPVLKDTVNLPDVQDVILTKRRSKQISYKEPNLHKKLRRE